NHAHYALVRRKIRAADEALGWAAYPDVPDPPSLDAGGHTAVFVVGSSRSGGIYALEWVRREFPGEFRNCVFMNVRTVDARSYGGGEELGREHPPANAAGAYFVKYCHQWGLR